MILFEDRASGVLGKVLNVIENKKFLLPLNICSVVPNTLLKANKEFDFIDVSLDTLCMNQDKVLKKIKEDNSVDGILFVKTFGVDFDIQPFYRKIKKINNNIFIIDDMCPCVPVFDYNIEKSYADMSLFSSGYSKYIDIGYGGYGFIKDEKFIKIFEDLSKNKYFLDYKKTIINKTSLIKIHKNELNSIYKDNIHKKYHLGDDFINWRFSILVSNKEEILQAILEEDGVFASSHYPQIDYEYKENPMANSNANKIHKKIINLFNDFKFTREQAYLVVDVVNKYIR
mgnify:FL=1